MKKVLVTGANGFVGQHVLRELANHDVETIAIGGRRPDLADNDTVLSLDLSDREQAAQLNFDGVDGVIHLAGLAAVGPSFDNPIHYITTNSAIENNLFEVAKQQGVTPRFLVISSAALYSASAPLPITESSPVTPSSPYAVSKLTQEFLAQYYQQRGFEVMIARPFNHIGPGQGPGFIVPDITQQVIACKKGEQQEVSVGNLDAQRDYTDVRDIARAYRLLLEKGLSGETYNVCSGAARSGNDILRAITAAADADPRIVQDPSKMRPVDNPVVRGDFSKLQRATGWQPAITFESTIQDVVSDWQQ